MKEWFKKCPFCANEIKEWAIKCQFCEEFLEIKEDESKNISEKTEVAPIKTQSTPVVNKKYLWIWIIIVFFLVCLFVYGRWNSRNNSVDLDDFLNDLNTDIETDYNSNTKVNSNYNSDEQLLFDEFKMLNDEYWNKKKEWGTLAMNGADDYKSLEALNKCIDDLKLYKKYSKEFYDGVYNLKQKYTDVDEYQKLFMAVILDIFLQEDKATDKHIEFLSYITTIQDEFNIIDWRIIFNSENEAKEKYLQLAKETGSEDFKVHQKYMSGLWVYANKGDYVDFTKFFNR